MSPFRYARYTESTLRPNSSASSFTDIQTRFMQRLLLFCSSRCGRYRSERWKGIRHIAADCGRLRQLTQRQRRAGMQLQCKGLRRANYTHDMAPKVEYCRRDKKRKHHLAKIVTGWCKDFLSSLRILARRINPSFKGRQSTCFRETILSDGEAHTLESCGNPLSCVTGRLILVRSGAKLKWLKFICPCGCGEEQALNLMSSYRPFWRVELHQDHTITVFPSVHALKCGAHFWIRRNRIFWF
jgi:hypothetical protein